VEQAETWLVVDDTEGDLIHMERSLAHLTGEVGLLTARDRTKALEILERHRVDACILDYYLSEEPGDAFIARVAQKYPHVPLIVVSNLTDTSKTIRSSGADWVMPKVADARAFGQMLTNAVRQAQSVRKLRMYPLTVADLYVPTSLEQQIRNAVALPRGNVLVSGSEGMGRTSVGKFVARAIWERNPAFGASVHFLNCKDFKWDAKHALGLEEEFFGKRGQHEPILQGESLFERAAGGVLFLDDVHCIPGPLQERLKASFDADLIVLNSGRTVKPSSVKIVMTVSEDAEDEDIIPGFLCTLAKFHVSLPSAKELVDDDENALKFLVDREGARRKIKVRMNREAKTLVKAQLVKCWKRLSMRSLTHTVEAAALAAASQNRAIIIPSDFGRFLILNDRCVPEETQVGSEEAFLESKDPVGIDAWKELHRIVTGDATLKEAIDEFTKLLFRYRHFANAGNMNAIAKSLNVKRTSIYKSQWKNIVN